MFGIPSYRSSITGNVFYVTADEGVDGCSPIEPEPYWPNNTALIFLMDRGQCSFVQKVRNAQNAGASAAIVVNFNDDVLPFMVDDGTGSSVSIPSMLITNSDGGSIKRTVETNRVMMEMAWSIPHPDNVVNVNFWTSTHDPLSTRFKSVFGDIQRAMGDKLVTQPHFKVVDGEISGCLGDTQGSCDGLCIMDGRYCAPDPEGNRSIGLDGSDIVRENLRQICAFKVASKGGDVNKQAKWWDYISQFEAKCGTKQRWGETCANEILSALSISPAEVKQCIKESGGTEAKSTNTLLEKAINDAKAQNIVYTPTFVVNGTPYRGSLSCPDPLDVSTCGPLQMICEGFEDGKRPAACSSSPGCPLGQVKDACNVCGGKAKDISECIDEKKSGGGVSVGTVIIIVLVVVIIVGVAVFFYMRRQQNVLKDDIDSLLRQYLPLDAANSLASPNKDGFLPAHATQSDSEI